MVFCSLCQGRSLDDPEEEFTHPQCLVKLEGDELSVRIYLVYHKQGDDLKKFSVHSNGVLDPYKSFEDLAWFLEEIARRIRELTAVIKGADPSKLTLVADNYYIRLTGPREIILPLVYNKLCTFDP